MRIDHCDRRNLLRPFDLVQAERKFQANIPPLCVLLDATVCRDKLMTACPLTNDRIDCALCVDCERWLFVVVVP